jgi:hypothetical protein
MACYKQNFTLIKDEITGKMVIFPPDEKSIQYEKLDYLKFIAQKLIDIELILKNNNKENER